MYFAYIQYHYSVVPSQQKTTAVSTPKMEVTTTMPWASTIQLTYTTQYSTVTPTPTKQEICDTPTLTIQQTTVILTPITQEVTATPKTMEPVVTPTISSGTPPANKTTCDVLAELAKSSEIFDCEASTNEPCDRVDCATELIGINFTAEVVVLPCHAPPAAQIAMSRDGKVVMNRTVYHSQMIFIPELFNLNLYVTLDQYKGAIGLQVRKWNRFFVYIIHFLFVGLLATL